NEQTADIKSIGDPASLAAAMATTSKQSRAVASISLSPPGATESSQCEVGRTSSAVAADIRRSADGSIDFAFYTARAHAIRQLTIAGLGRALSQTICAALARFYAAIFLKRGKE